MRGRAASVVCIACTKGGRPWPGRSPASPRSASASRSTPTPARRSEAGAATRRRGFLLGLSGALLGAAAPATRATEVAPGLFVLPGVDEDASAANLDGIANTGFVLGREAV